MGSESVQASGVRLKARAVDAAKRFAVMFLYLWVLFSLFVLQERIVLAHEHIDGTYTQLGFALVNALILAKVMLVADDLHLARQLEHRPLVYSVLYKSLAFGILFVCFDVAEEIALGALHGRPALDSLPPFARAGWSGVVTVGLVTFVELIPFFAVRELSGVLGEGELGAIMFSRSRPPLGPVR